MIYSLVFGAIAVGFASALWAIRLPQVVIFGVASAFRRPRAADADPGEKVQLWGQVSSPTAQPLNSNPKAMITYHADYHSFSPTMAVSAISSCATLGAGWIRTDIRWNRILPDGSTPNARAIAWYRQFLLTARNHGLKNMVVLSTPPPAVKTGDAGKRRAGWLRFLDLVGRELGSTCDAYQLMNEPNNPVYSFFSRSECPPALKEGTAIIRGYYPSALIAINVSMDIWGWRDYVEDLLAHTDSAIDIVGLDHYPHTWTIGLGDRWRDIVKLTIAISHGTGGSLWSNRKLAICETGYCTNAPLRTEREQALYFLGLGRVIEQFKSSGALALLGVYELCDRNSSSWLDPESHFGIMTSDLRAKEAFGAVADLFKTF